MGNQYGQNGGNRALARPAQQQQAGTLAQIKPADQLVLTTMRESAPDLVRRATEIMLSRPANKPISAPRALAAAMREAATGQVEGRDFYVDEKMGIVDSYRGVQNETAAAFYHQFRPLTTDEASEHELQAGDNAIVCEVYSARLRDIAQAVGAPYRPVLGVGIVRKHEKFQSSAWDQGQGRSVRLPEDKWGGAIDPPVGRSWRWKAEQRAYKDALRHLPNVPASVKEILAQADDEGIDMPAGIVGYEQAQAAVAIRRDDAQRATDAPRQHISLGQPEGFEGFGDDGPSSEQDAGPSWDGLSGQDDDDTGEGETGETGEATDAVIVCERHHVPMKQHTSQTGRIVWWHGMSDGGWCDGENEYAGKGNAQPRPDAQP